MLRILWLAPCSVWGSGLFTKQLRCLNGTCSNVLSGLITLTNEEAFEYESFNVKDIAAGGGGGGGEVNYGVDAEAGADIPVMLKIEKSRLLIAYGLSWEKDVLGGVHEDVYDYSWANAGGSHAFEGNDFDGARCSEELRKKKDASSSAQTLSLEDVKDSIEGESLKEVEKLLQAGRVCGCKDTGWGGGSYTDVHRASLNCNAWPAVFRPGSTTWASRHCPRMKGPQFGVYSITEWKWEYHVKVTMTWTTLTGVSRVRSYYLNWTNPEVKDEELDFTFKILFSLAQFGQNPPDLHATHYLLVPKDLQEEGLPEQEETADRADDFLYSKMTNAERKLDSFRGASLLVPKEMVDLSGRSCDKIGVSLFSWARETNDKGNWVGQNEFCSKKPGDCIHLQPNDLLENDRKLLKAGKRTEYTLLHKTLDGWSPGSPYLLSDRSIFSPNRTKEEDDDHTNTPPTRRRLAVTGSKPVASLVAWPTTHSHSTQLEVSLNSSDIAWLPNVSMGEMEDVIVYPIAGGTMVNVVVLVRNKEPKEAKFTASVPQCTLENEDAADEARNEESSPKTLHAAPVSQNIKGDKTAGIMITLDRRTGMSKATYACQVQLINSQGTLLKTEAVTVEFDRRQNSLASLNKPLHSDSRVNNYKINPSDLSAIEYNNNNHLRAIGEASGAWYGNCNCDLWNLWCFATHIVDCTKLVRSVIIFGGCLAGGSILLVTFLPCIVRTCASCASFTAQQVDKSRKEIRRRRSSDATVPPLDITRRELTTAVESSIISTPTSVCTPPRHYATPRQQCGAAGYHHSAVVNRTVRSRCSRRASHDYYSSPAVHSGRIPDDGRKYVSRNSTHVTQSRRCSPGCHIVAAREGTACCSSRPTTASLKKTPPPQRPRRQSNAADERRRELLRTLREKRNKRIHSSSSYAADYSSGPDDDDRPVV